VQLVFLYGPPAVGKYTIGVELAARTGLRLLHNHLSVNLVSAVFDRDSEAWTPLLRSIRRDILIEATRHDVSLIMTGVFRGTSDHVEGWRTMLEPVRTNGGRIAFVQLVCDPDELVRRVKNESRRALDKLVDPVRLAELLDGFDMLSPAPFGEHLRLDVTHRTPRESAERIMRYYGIHQR
jgi:shikimate kinase